MDESFMPSSDWENIFEILTLELTNLAPEKILF